jgi:hypothetical protein
MSVSHLGSNLSRLTLFALLTRLDMMHERDACQRRMPVYTGVYGPSLPSDFELKFAGGER